MSMPVRETDSYVFAAPLQQKKINKISEQENNSSLGKVKINDSVKEDTVNISRESLNITKEFERTEEGNASELKELEQQNRDSEKRAETVQREQLRFKEENWDRIEDERIEDREVKAEYEGRSASEMESPDRVSEAEQRLSEREEDLLERSEEIIAEQEAEIEEEKVLRDEEAVEAKSFTASYINDPSSPGNIINVIA